MQQEYLDSSKYQISLHSIDSRFSDLNNNVNSEFRVQNPAPLKNIIRIRLASVEVPLVEPMFSQVKGNVTFSVLLGGSTTYTQSDALIDGNYSSANLISVFQEKLQDIDPNFTVTLNQYSNTVTIRNTTNFVFDFASTNNTIASRATHWGLGYYLGFRDTVAVSTFENGVYSVKSDTVINVNPNPYYLVKLKCPEDVVNVTHRLDGGGFISAFAKVILSNNYYQIQFDNNSNLVRNEYTFLSPVNIPFFQISLVDPWGELVNMMNIEWSYTVEVTEIKNSKEYSNLMTTYKRAK
jgi:hypothetical protein